MKIVGFEVESWEKQAFGRLQTDHQVLLTDQAVAPDTDSRYRDAEIISTFIYSDLSADSLSQFQNLKLIATRSTGFDHIDLDYCREHGVAVSNVPGYADQTVAEHVFALLLALGRNVVVAADRTRKGDFSQGDLQGFEFRGKTLGVIGTGSIGKHVIAIGKGFGMDVLAFDVKPDRKSADRLGYRYADMDEVLSNSDVVTLHVPGGPKTRNLISQSQLASMKSSAVLINTARGEVVDVQALLRALSDGQISAAGLDVLPEEPVIGEETELIRSIFTNKHDLGALFAGHMLVHLPNVLITPHIGFNTREAVDRLLDTSIENIVSFVQGNPQNLVGDA